MSVERLRVRAVRVARVRDPDRRDVHRGAAVDDVPDAGLARVGVAVAELEHEPLLGQEEAVVEEILAAELRDPRLLVDDPGQHQPLDVVRVEVVALRRRRRRTSTRVMSVSSVTWPSPLWKGENGFSIPRARRIDSTIPVTQPS